MVLFNGGVDKVTGSIESNARKNTFLKNVEMVYGTEFLNRLGADVKIFSEGKFSGSVAGSPLENAYNFSFTDVKNNSNYADAEMPFPFNGTEFYVQEWGTPKKAVDEQFHIAMKWPYVPSTTEAEKDKFVKKYFNSMSKKDLVGTVEDYKNCHVMVYNPANDIAVVCKPAYFLWGETTSSFIKEDTDNAIFANFGNIEDTDVVELVQNIEISAVVSPDAAFFLGIISDPNASYINSEGTFVNGPGYNDLPKPKECYYAFVPTSIPLGVATSIFSPIKKFKGKDQFR
jgi:hypothetical protein